MLAHYQSEKALGCEVTLLLVSDADQKALDEYFRKLWLLIFEFENRCSRFLPDSELSQFNKTAGVKRPISSEFRDVLLATQRMANLSGDLYNPFVLPALQRAGYVKSMVSAHADDSTDDFSGRSVVSASELQIGSDWATIPYGTAIDIGGCGKGYIGDVLADQVDHFQGVQGFWLSLGGDVVGGGLDEHEAPWTISVEDAYVPDKAVGSITAKGRQRFAVATSSAIREAPKLGRRYHHIIDPRSGQPAKTDTVLATVYARSGIVADVLASCLIITGSTGAEDYLRKRDVLGALLQTDGHKLFKLGAMQALTAPKRPEEASKT